MGRVLTKSCLELYRIYLCKFCSKSWSSKNTNRWLTHLVFSLLNVNCCPVGRPKNLYFFVFFQVAPSVGSFLSPSTLSKMAYFCPWQFKAVAWLWLWSTNLGYTIDVLWDQPINFIHVASTSEFCENQQNNLLFLEIVLFYFCGASEVQI